MMSMGTTQEKHLSNLIRALQQEAETLGGYGEIVVRVAFHAGLPLTMDVVERRKRYRISGADEHGN
jgi:hypothetical protein